MQLKNRRKNPNKKDFLIEPKEHKKLFDICGHVARLTLEPKNHYEKGINTLNFVKWIDEKWNLAYNINRSTQSEFKFPKWYTDNIILHF